MTLKERLKNMKASYLPEALELGYQMTAYESLGSVGHEELLEVGADELETDLSYIGCYNEWLEVNNNYDDVIYSVDELDEILQGLSPVEIIKKWNFGNNSFADDYFMFDGYANIKTLPEFEIMRMLQDPRFKMWYIEEYTPIDPIIEAQAIAYSNALIEAGY